jgi:hypothetical protein
MIEESIRQNINNGVITDVEFAEILYKFVEGVKEISNISFIGAKEPIWMIKNTSSWKQSDNLQASYLQSFII